MNVNALKRMAGVAKHSMNAGALRTIEHSPKVMFGAGLAGMIGTVVLASRATLKLEETLEETQKNLKLADEVLSTTPAEKYSKADHKRDKAIITVRGALQVAKLYAPAIALGGISVALLTGSHVTLTRRNASLMAAYAAVDEGFKKYRARVISDLGEEKDLEYRHGVATTVETGFDEKGNGKTTERKHADPNEISMYARFFDETCRNWNREGEYNYAFLKNQQNYANDRLRTRGFLFLNEVYEMLGLEKSKAGAIVGWVIDKDTDCYVDFGLFTRSTQEVRDFVNLNNNAILLDFNVDGVIINKLKD